MNQPPLFDMAKGEQLKQAGMHQAADAVPTWADMARQAVEFLAASGLEFTSEDVTDLVGLPRVDVGQHRNNAVGAVMSGAARRGVIRRVRYQHSQRPVSHAAVLSVWMGT